MIQKKSLPPLVGTKPDPHSRDVGKKAASHWVEVAGGLGSIRRHTRLHFSPGSSLRKRRRKRRRVEKELKRRRRRLRISGGSVRLGRTKIARSIQESQPAQPPFPTSFPAAAAGNSSVPGQNHPRPTFLFGQFFSQPQNWSPLSADRQHIGFGLLLHLLLRGLARMLGPCSG